MSNEASATLICHRGAQKVNRDELRSVETPGRTKSWVPIPHIDLVENVERALAKRGVRIESEDLAVQSAGKVFFGVMKLSYGDTGEHKAALGLRASNNKAFAVQMCAGLSVFVCDNLAFSSADGVFHSRKHTTNIDLGAEVDAAVCKFEERYTVLSTQLDALKGMAVTDDTAKMLIYDAVVRQKLLPVTYLPELDREYFNPTFPAHQPGSLYTLQNAFTHVLKRMNVGAGMTANVKVGRYFGLHGKVGGAERLMIAG